MRNTKHDDIVVTIMIKKNHLCLCISFLPNIWRAKKPGRFGAVVFVDVYLCLCVWWQPSKGEKRPPLGVKPNTE